MIKYCQKIKLQEPQRNRNATANYVNLIMTSTVTKYCQKLVFNVSVFRGFCCIDSLIDSLFTSHQCAYVRHAYTITKQEIKIHIATHRLSYKSRSTIEINNETLYQYAYKNT